MSKEQPIETTLEVERILDAMSMMSVKQINAIPYAEVIPEVLRRRKDRISEVRREAGKTRSEKKSASSRGNISKAHRAPVTESTRAKMREAQQARRQRERFDVIALHADGSRTVYQAKFSSAGTDKRIEE